MKKHFSIAIDGPSGAGKSVLSIMAAKRFSFIHVDTGAIYRTVGLFVFDNGIDSKDRAGVIGLLPKMKIEMRYENGMQRMLLNGEDVTDRIRLPEISIYASNVSAMPEVRDFLLKMQRDLALMNNVIMDGRDIGTVVLPDADLKIFLTALPSTRASRRHKELCEKGLKTSFYEVLRDIEYRDENDSSRETAPLRPAPDSIFVDTTEKTLEESYEIICEIIAERLKI